MKKILCVIGLMLLLLLILGCDSYTQISVYPSDSSNILNIDLPGHTLNENSPYEIIYTDDGCDVIIHFTNNKEGQK